MRIRTIKPEFWKSERLAGLSRDARLLFAGLWNLSDDYGRFRAHPAIIRGELFPFDSDADVPKWLGELAGAGRVVLYVHEGQQYGWVRKFDEHQKIDKRATSRLPEPPASKPAVPANVPAEPAQKPAEPAEKVGLEQGAGSREVEQGAGSREQMSAEADALVSGWREICGELAQWQEPIGRGRRKAVSRALKRRPLAQWLEVFARVASSSFCAGVNDRGWKADLDWALRPEGSKSEPAANVLEGKYDDRAGPPPRNAYPDAHGGIIRSAQ